MKLTLLVYPCLALGCLGVPVSAQCEVSQFTAMDVSAMDDFGSAIDVDGDRAIVGVPNDDEGGTDRGTAYIFERVGGVWIEMAKLSPSDPGDFDLFGFKVGVSGDTALVGALSNDDFGFDSGSAYVFERQGPTTWVETQKLLASDGAFGDLYSIGLDIEGDRIIIGACQLTSFIVFGTGAGKSYVYDRVGPMFTESQILTTSDASHGDAFGISVSLEGDRVLIGAEEDDDNGASSGSAYIFELDTGTWVQRAKMIASDGMANDFFGSEISLSGDLALIGAHSNDEFGADAGAAYVFERQSPTSWTQEQKLTASDAAIDDKFGDAVALEGSKAVVGAYQNLGNTEGALYVFDRQGTIWSEAARLVASDSVVGDELGYAVALDGDTLLASARADDNTGTAYEFNPATASINFYGCGVNPVDSLTVFSGTPRVGTMMSLGIDNPAGSQSPGAIPFLAFAVDPAPGFPCGVAVPNFGMSGPTGELLISLTPPNPVTILVGTPWTGAGIPALISFQVPVDCNLITRPLYAQGLLLDPPAAMGVKFGLTDAVQLFVGH